jgi:5-methylcytosine-specific restriction endonuclease McrA
VTADREINKGGSVTALVRLIRKLPEYEEWKRAVFIRDRFQCQHCGKRNGRKPVIEADHIKSLAQLVRENQVTSVVEALGCSALWDVNNGRTLCHGCHELTDTYPVNFRRKLKKKNI